MTESTTPEQPEQPESEQGRAQQNPDLTQMAEGVKQFAAGAKGFFDTSVAPKAKSFYEEQVAPAAKKANERISETLDHASEAGASSKSQLAVWTKRAPLLVPAAAFVGIIALFLPVASAMGLSVTMFSDAAGGEGAFLLVAFLIVIGLMITAAITKQKWASITGAIVAVLVGLIAMFDGFGNMVTFAKESGVSVGFGTILLGVMGLAIAAGGVLMLLGLRRKK